MKERERMREGDRGREGEREREKGEGGGEKRKNTVARNDKSKHVNKL